MSTFDSLVVNLQEEGYPNQLILEVLQEYTAIFEELINHEP
tara:strand:+ start:4580 stop:4702 length:123 start_codon:yes stop_codon:yes gene_type:complete